MPSKNPVDWKPRLLDKKSAEFAYLMKAARSIVPDWDGERWSTVREMLQSVGKTDAQIEAMTVDRIGQCLAMNQKRLIEIYRGQPHTSAVTVIGGGYGEWTRGETKGAAGGGGDESSKKKPKPQIRLTESAGIVTINGGDPIRLNGQHSVAFVRVLLKERGRRVKATEFAKLGIRADREYAKLPERLKTCISKPGRGQSGYYIDCRK